MPSRSTAANASTPSGGTVTVTGNLAVPSDTDGYAIGNIAHNPGGAGTGQWVVTHNTCVGKQAFIAFNEVTSDTGTKYSSVKSNLCVDPSTSAASVVFDLNVATDARSDLSDPANTGYNGKFGAANFTDPDNGHVYAGYHGRYSADPGANDVVANPNFVDVTRNFPNWSVHKGAASGGDSLTTRFAATVALLEADPTLMRTDLLPWVRGGFAPTNAALHNTGHDGTDIGAVAFQSSGYTLTAAAGTFTETGQDARLLATRRITAAAGAFTESGQAATLKATRLVTAAAGSYALTGNDAGLSAGIPITVSDATIDTTGNGVLVDFATHGGGHLTTNSPTGFTLKRNSVTEACTATLISNLEVQLVGANGPFFSDDTVTFSITSTDLTDQNGDPTSNVTNHAVTNSSTLTEPSGSHPLQVGRRGVCLGSTALLTVGGE
jgi:hypothetical protein